MPFSHIVVPPISYTFILLPDYPLSAVSLCLDVLTAANRHAATPAHPLYQWAFCQESQTVSWSGASFGAITKLNQIPNSDIIFLCGGESIHRAITPKLIHHLQCSARRGTRIGAIGSGVQLLAAAGLAEGYRLAVHTDYRAAIIEQFPGLNITETLFEIDRDRVSCSGIGAALDMMLTLIAADQGSCFAAVIGEYLMHGVARQPCDASMFSLQTRLGVSHPRLGYIIARMEGDLENALCTSRLARQAGISTRQMERLFKRYFASTPKRYHLNLRLFRARRLLLQTNIPIIHVGLACGFESAAHFSKSYRMFFGYAPSYERGEQSLAGAPSMRRAGQNHTDRPQEETVESLVASHAEEI